MVWQDSLHYGTGLFVWYGAPNDSHLRGSERGDHYANVTVERKRILKAYGANIIFTDPGEFSLAACNGRIRGIGEREVKAGARISSNSWGAPVAGAYWEPLPETCPSGPMSLRHVHGLADPTVPMKGRSFQQRIRLRPHPGPCVGWP